MKLTIIGGGGFRVPQIFQAVAGGEPGVTELCLHDVSAERLTVIRTVLDQLADHLPRPPRVTATLDLDEALRGADVIFSAMRIGGTGGRVQDEVTALELGVLGQETVGPGGLAYALRTLPHARALADRVRRVAPEAWLINFTNPAGIITEAMRAVLGDQVIGICDTPIGLVRRAARAAGHRPDEVSFDYVGLNHLGWLRSLEVRGRDVLPGLLAHDERLAGLEEARTLGPAWVRALGALPNEYLFYYYATREALAHMRAGGPTRGQYLHEQQEAFYRAAARDPEEALAAWDRTRHERESSYMGETRSPEQRFARAPEDVDDGGYQQVALELMTALTTGTTTTMILDVGNDSAGAGLLVHQLPADAVVEVPCTVDGEGVHPHHVAPVAGEMAGLMVQVKTAEQLALRASTERSAELAWRALAAHPVVDSVAVARQLLDDYRDRFPELARLLA
ncbi:6-phospho-beta-glucosidase [Georgenia sp. 10Sc9-8]|uniref:6-phospho-beta-glucosidase n=1 Tax=Georgenia halotolerans TaxID=3028317 RepID=A0ABT5TZU5_9MICO|nr:6-phospho-beta-glucosidase [Georgenia halotolerans]